MARAFEVERTTAYSGILRMVDLRALQPNMQCVSTLSHPMSGAEKFFGKSNAPSFRFSITVVYEKCTFLSYDSVQSIMSDTIMDEYEEHAEEG